MRIIAFPSIILQTNIHTLEVWHANRTVCIISGPQEIGKLEVSCYKIDDFNISWRFAQPEILSGFRCMYRSIIL